MVQLTLIDLKKILVKHDPKGYCINFEDATEYIEQGNTYKYTFNYDTKAKQYYFYSVEKVKE